MDNLSIVIMAHPSRASFIPSLKEKLGDVRVVWDEKNHLWDTCRRSWLAQDMSKEYALVVQDDAIACDNFYERIAPILKDDAVYQLYAGDRMARKIDTAIEAGSNLVVDTRMYNEVALCMKTKHIADMVAYCDRRGAQNDRLIQTFARLQGLKFHTPIPSLFDHRAGPSIYRSLHLIPEPSKHRKAYRFAQ